VCFVAELDLTDGGGVEKPVQGGAHGQVRMTSVRREHGDTE
jgi:hypothetical protein